MGFTVTERYGAAVIQIQGRFLGSLEWDTFREALSELRDARKKHVILDFSEASFIDSSGLGVLITGLTSMRRDGGDLRLAGLTARVREVFAMTRLLGTVFQEYPGIEEAEQSYRAHPPAPAGDVPG